MSERIAPRPTSGRTTATPITLGAIALLVMLAIVGGRSAGGVLAQSTPIASPVASPTTGDCTPAENPDAAAAASPAASPAADDPASEPAGTPAAGADAETITAAVENVAFCYNAGDLEALLTLVTPNLLQDKFGTTDAGALADAELLPYTVLSVSNVATYDDGRGSVDVVYLAGDYQYVSATWYLTEIDGQLLLDEEALQAAQPDGDTALVSFSVADDASPVAFDQFTEIGAQEVVILYGSNNGAEQHVFNLYLLSEESAATAVATPAAVAEAFPDDVTFVGQVSLAPGERGDIALVAPAEGTYALVDPAVEGSAATLTITPAVPVETP